MDTVILAFLLAGIVLAVGALASYLFRRTGFPELLFLIALGAMFGPFLGLIEPSSVLPLAPYLATLALIVILFEGGLNLDLRRTILESPRAVVLASLGFLLAVGFTVLFWIYVLDLGLVYGLLLGGAFSILIFGLILGNDVHILRFLHKAEMSVVDEGMRRFEAEIAFLIRTFFFLYLGLMIALTALSRYSLAFYYRSFSSRHA